MGVILLHFTMSFFVPSLGGLHSSSFCQYADGGQLIQGKDYADKGGVGWGLMYSTLFANKLEPSCHTNLDNCCLA